MVTMTTLKNPSILGLAVGLLGVAAAFVAVTVWRIVGQESSVIHKQPVRLADCVDMACNWLQFIRRNKLRKTKGS